MRFLELIPVPYRWIGIALLLALVAGGGGALAWQIQAWRFGLQLAQNARLQAEAQDQFNRVVAAQQRATQEQRLGLEQRLQASEQSHYQELTDVQTDQARLRDRLATADLRLSVLLDADDSATHCAVPATSGAGSVVHGAPRARLDPAHAQRIIAITDDGDRALIALKACQAYVQTISR